jgi:succinate dehydrogenase / fumarate reductase membrane anchor subunit
MRYLTDRKRATGMGSAKSGTAHFWAMKVSSVALLILVPLFVFTFGAILGAPYEEVVAYYSRPFPAIVAALTLIVGLEHFQSGAQVLIEDYVHGTAEKNHHHFGQMFGLWDDGNGFVRYCENGTIRGKDNGRISIRNA